MEFFYILLAIVLMFWIFRISILLYRNKIKKDFSKDLSFLLVKIPKKYSDSDRWDDNIQWMKNNIQVMEQVLKNFYWIYDTSFFWRYIFQPYISFDVVVEKESIKFIVWMPSKHKESFEKTISSFYVWASVEDTKPPKVLEAWKYAYGWYIVLTKDDAFPIKSYDKFEADPMDSILSSFSKVTVDEKLQLQILVQPISAKWQKVFRNKIKKIKSWWFFGKLMWSWKSNAQDDRSWLWSTQIQDMETKIQDEWFNIIIKTFANSPNPKRPRKIIEDLWFSMNQYNYVWLNSFIFLKMKNLDLFGREFVQHIFKKPIFTIYKWLFFINKNILNIKEIASIVHFPHSRFNKNPRISWQKFKIVPAPDNIPFDWIYLGDNIYSWVKKEIKISKKDRFRHFYIIWQTGTGKSTMINVQAKQDMQNWNWFAIIDPHGDLCKSLISYYPKERVNDLVYFDASNQSLPFGLNLLEPSSPDDQDSIDMITNDAIELFVKLYWPEIFGPRLIDYFSNAAMTLMEQPDWWTLLEVMRLFTDQAFQKTKVWKVKNPSVRQWWHKTYDSMWDREKWEIIPYFQAKFWPLTTNWMLRNIIWQAESSFDVSEIMDSWKILLINLSKWKIWDINSKLLGLIMVAKIKQAAMARANVPEDERKDYFMYIDEFQNYITPSIEVILSEARKYRLWLIIAHQYIEQLKQKDLWWDMDLTWAIFWNVGTMMSYKVGAPDAEFLEKEFSPEFSKQDLINIDKFKWVVKISIDTQPSRPFSLNVPNPYTEHDRNTDEKSWIIKQISSLKYWRKRDLVEKEVFYRIGW